jgi:outer membrane protein OmpA-like peptidoglycan-associated protein
MRQFIVGFGAVLILSAASPTLAQEPPPQFTVEELQREFSKPNQAGSCEDQGMVTGAGGRCEPKPVTRGFSLTAPKQQAAPKGKVQPAPAASPGRRRPSGSAVATAAAPAPRVQGRDLLITFANGSSTLTPQARSNAKVFADALRTPQLNSLRFEIAGHTNATGTRTANQSLSQQRAQALVDYLVSLGVDPGRFEAKGFGFDRPINAADPRAAENRRVEARRLN